MFDLTWSHAEKKLARAVFDAAVQAELDELLTTFKHRAAAAQAVADVWALRDWLDRRQREIDALYDYRYSQLIDVFGQLLARGRIDLPQLQGLSADKVDLIARYAGRRP